MEVVYARFPHIPVHKICRPVGQVDILLGQDYAGYLPVLEEVQEHLLLLASHFGSGLLVSGRTGAGGETVCDHVLTEQACEYGKASRIAPASARVNFASSRLPSFFEAEDLACLPPISCLKHRSEFSSCRDCSFRGQKMSLRERRALERMEDSIQRQPDGSLSIRYPFNEYAYL